MAEKTFEVGDEVTWASQSLGFWKQKTGTVVAVVPARTSPKTYIDAVAKQHKGHVVRTDGGGLLRNHVSYLVLVVAEAPSKAKPKLYWPIVSKLQAA
jgi:hypothetical protein